MLTHPDLLWLAAFRLQHDLSFTTLGAAMAAAGYPIRPRALHLILTDKLQTGPYDRTIYKVRQFRAHLQAGGPVPTKTPRRRTSRRQTTPTPSRHEVA